jgi:predicted O-methyltransferase YrrM
VTSEVRRVIDRLVRDGTAVARSNGTVHQIFPVGVGVAEGEALRDSIVREQATRTIEVGLGYAISALFACEALIANDTEGACHVVIDPYQRTRFADCGLQFLDEAGVSKLVEFHGEESQIVLPRFVSEGRVFDLAFVDGNHRFDGVFLDLVYLGRLVRGSGIVFVDDYQLAAVARATRFCTTNLAWTLEDESRADELHQWAVLRTPRSPADRPYDHFVDFFFPLTRWISRIS